MNATSIKFRGHRCFKKEWAGFDAIKPINVVIGRNNTGKSQLLDLIEAVCGNALNDKKDWEIRVTSEFTKNALQRVFHESHSGGELGGNFWTDHGHHFVGEKFVYEQGSNRRHLVFADGENAFARGADGISHRAREARRAGLIDVASRWESSLRDCRFRRIAAERDVHHENESQEMPLAPNGNGATNIIRRFLLSASSEIDYDLIQNDFLSALNEVFASDGIFTHIEVKIHDKPSEPSFGSSSWEIFLREAKKGSIALSKSGSGLKTVILVLLNLLVVPRMEKLEKSRYVFAFEELENNLHPALLRRLFGYIERYVAKEKATIFLTTHSPVALDVFGLNTDAQIVHVTHNGEFARTQTVAAHFDRQGVISELGAKPSDLLQANGVVWVEGPSDRIYLNRWIELVSNSELKEGRDYLCAFYGGALLAKVQFSSPEEAKAELVNLLRANPNVAVVCDSDLTAKSGEGGETKERVRRVSDEVAKIPNGRVWVTAAKEIENYLPQEVLRKIFAEENPPAPEQFERFFPSDSDAKATSFVEQRLKRKGLDKVELATKAVPHMTVELMRQRFDWSEKMAEIADAIRKWNG